MFHEIAITPSVFKTDSYPSREVCDSEMRGVWAELNGCLVVRDLREGDWAKDLWQKKTESPHWAQKVLQALKKSKRLRRVTSAISTPPTNAEEWCNEALSSHENDPLSGVLTCGGLHTLFGDNAVVCSIDRRHQESSWWTQLVVRGSARIPRNTAGYLSALGVLLRSANHLSIMDPHLDPSHRDYREFKELLLAARRGDGVQPKIEIHRVSYLGVSNRTFPTPEEWENRFRTALKQSLEQAGLDAEVFIWPDEHDRHILSDLGGIHMGNGLKIFGDPNATSTWTRLPCSTFEDVQRKFDPAVNAPVHRFSIVNSD